MNREIKFRGKSLETGKFVFGYYITDTTATENASILEQPVCGFSMCQDEDLGSLETAVKLETVGQFTEHKDKDGIEIYHGDIVEFGLRKRIKGTISLSNHGALISTQDVSLRDSLLGLRLSHDLKVIGNIYDDPKLINNN